MSAATLTEAEQERIARAKIDRVKEIRLEYAQRKGIAPADVRLPPGEIERAEREATESTRPSGRPANPTSRSQQILDACKRLAGEGGNVERARLYEAVGAGSPEEKSKVNGLVYALRGDARFPYILDGFGKPGPKPKAATKPQPEFSALKRAINGTDSPPRAAAPKPAPAPEPDPPMVGIAHPTNPARLAELAAGISRQMDGLDADERAFVLAFVRHRYD